MKKKSVKSEIIVEIVDVLLYVCPWQESLEN